MGKQIRRGPTLVAQGIYEESATALHRVGERLQLGDGRVFYYAKNGAVALTPGTLLVEQDQTALHINLSCAAAAIGDKEVTVTLGATAATANEYAEGYLSVNDGTGEGHIYKIKSHPAADASATLKVKLYDGINVALVASATSEVSLLHNPYYGVIISVADQANCPVGVAVIATTAAYYCWVQTWGVANVLADEAVAQGDECTIGTSVVGAVEAVDAVGEPRVGISMCGAMVDTEYKPVMLQIMP